ncbi:piggyBac transposable element-derived protein 3-like [Palaemon carinicauda]|uniref:piggyBac transposable element-derived protein 3-like n=1 Tax=Palaemon carinicauda TaxID=392227 RepID=UPI0035B5CE54
MTDAEVDDQEATVGLEYNRDDNSNEIHEKVEEIGGPIEVTVSENIQANLFTSDARCEKKKSEIECFSVFLGIKEYRPQPKLLNGSLNLQEILEILDEEEKDPVAIFITPPEVREDSDEDSAEEDEGGLADNLNSNQLRASAEAVFHDGRILGEDDDEVENSNVNCAEEQQESKKRKKSQKTSLEYNWKKTSNIRFSVNQTQYDKPPPAIDLKGKSPVEKFEYFFDGDIMNMIAKESCRYACEKNAQFTISVSELRVAFGIFILSGYHTLPSRRLYWSLDADVGVELVAKAMSRDRFEEILRPLMNHLNTKFAMAYPMDQHISLDEAMIEYFGRRGCKQCIRNKPVRFGFKAWCLNSSLGYLATFDVYQGTAFGLDRHYEERLGKGGGTSMILFEKLPSHIKDIPVRFYFYNYFTSLPLVNHLREINYGATGTIRDNRITKTCPINSTNEMKKVPRGDTDVVVDNIYKILLVRWKDNAVVSVVSNISPVYPLESVSRWSAKDKKKMSVSHRGLQQAHGWH